MWADMAIAGGLTALRSGLAYSDAKKTVEDKRKWRDYKNAMLMLADANNQNALTVNEGMAREKSANAAFQIERSEYLTSAQAEAAAAAADTGGRSVNMVMFDVERNAAGARARNQNDLEATYRQVDNQRLSSAFQAARQMDYSPLPEPDAATAALGLGIDMYKVYSRQNK